MSRFTSRWCCDSPTPDVKCKWSPLWFAIEVHFTNFCRKRWSDAVLLDAPLLNFVVAEECTSLVHCKNCSSLPWFGWWRVQILYAINLLCCSLHLPFVSAVTLVHNFFYKKTKESMQFVCLSNGVHIIDVAHSLLCCPLGKHKTKKDLKWSSLLY